MQGPASILSCALALAACALPAKAAGNVTLTPADDGARIRNALADPESVARARALWPVALEAPVVLHDSATGRSLRIDSDGDAVPVTLPAGTPLANTCIRLDGSPAAMVLAPLPDDEAGLRTLVWHERWHCMQESLGFTGREADNSHLDREVGRRWLRLELRALAAALRTGDASTRGAAARAALAFRAERHRVFPAAREAERALERNEGLAEYTGRRVALAPGERHARLLEALERGDSATSYVRSFAYLTGPAYGDLLDLQDPQWRDRLTADIGPADLAAMAYGVKTTAVSTPAQNARYGAAAVEAQERVRAEQHRARVEALHARLVVGPVLRLPLRSPNASFDPGGLVPLGDDGTAYTPLTLTDAWGRLASTSAALLARDWSHAQVPAPGATGCARIWRGDGWELELAPGWRLARAGDGLALEEGEPAPCD